MPTPIPLHKRPAVWFGALALLAPVSFLLAIPWLRDQADSLVYLFAGLAATLTVTCSMALAVLKDRKLDEWHRSGARFASQWGWLAGSAVLAVAMAFPPVQDAVLSLAGLWSGETAPDPRLVLLTFILGFMATVFLQMVATLALGAVWRYRMSRAG